MTSITLKTGNADVFSLGDITRSKGRETYFRCILEARSEWLSIRTPFAFYGHDLDNFIAALQSLDASLNGNAVLDFHYEPPTVTLTGNGRGSILVSIEMFNIDQRARVQFETDQTCLAPLIRDLEALSRDQNIS